MISFFKYPVHFFSLSILLFTSCAETIEHLPALNIGQEHQGGIIFYLNGSRQHGLIVAKSGWNGSPNDTAIVWGCAGTTITGADKDSVGTGAQNTIDIVNAGCLGAAKYCSDLNYNGYTDWFLPSLGELRLMINFNDQVDLGFKPNEFYYSSTENGLGATTIFIDDLQAEENTNKAEAHYFRPIRAF